MKGNILGFIIMAIIAFLPFSIVAQTSDKQLTVKPNDIKLIINETDYVHNWNARCSETTRRASNLNPTISMRLTKNGSPFSNQTIWVASDGNLLDNAVQGTFNRDPLTKIFYLTTDNNGTAVLKMSLDYVNIWADGLTEGKYRFTFTYLPPKISTVKDKIVQTSVNILFCGGCDDCIEGGKQPKSQAQLDVDEARKHIDWALDDVGACSQDIVCAFNTKAYMVLGIPTVVVRNGRNSREQIIRAIAALYASKIPALKNQNYEDLAFELVLSTQIHKDATDTQKWLESHKSAVISALKDVPIISTFTDTDLRKILSDMFGGISIP